MVGFPGPVQCIHQLRYPGQLCCSRLFHLRTPEQTKESSVSTAITDCFHARTRIVSLEARTSSKCSISSSDLVSIESSSSGMPDSTLPKPCSILASCREMPSARRTRCVCGVTKTDACTMSSAWKRTPAITVHACWPPSRSQSCNSRSRSDRRSRSLKTWPRVSTTLRTSGRVRSGPASWHSQPSMQCRI